VEALVAKYVALSPDELEEWQSDPEGYIRRGQGPAMGLLQGGDAVDRASYCFVMHLDAIG
jgi:hypothetical protein